MVSGHGGRPVESLTEASAVAEGTCAGLDDVTLMRTAGTFVLAAAVDRGTEVVGARVEARRVDVVISGEIAHGCDVNSRMVVVVVGWGAV